MTVRYIGRHPAVELDPDGLGLVEVERGQTVKVPAADAAGLLLQYSNWELVPAKESVASGA